jgi:hypothetical protein
MARTKLVVPTRREINENLKKAVVAHAGGKIAGGKTAQQIWNEADQRIKSRFNVMSDFTEAAIDGICRAMIASGPPGLGKSFEIERTLRRRLGPQTIDDDKPNPKYIIVKGYVLTTGLIRTLFRYRHEGCVIVFDDADTIFWDENSMNLLKTVCDTTEERTVSYMSEYEMEEDGEPVPPRFGFNGSVIFLTNINFDEVIANGTKIAPHLMALVSRAHYIDLTMYSNQDYLVRIKQVIDDGMLKEMAVDDRNKIIDFVHSNVNNLREVSLRMVIKVSNIFKLGKPNWKDIATITCCRNVPPDISARIDTTRKAA